MSGPRRHGARTARTVAACTLAFLALSAVFLRAGAASAHPAQRGSGHGARAQGGLLGGLLGAVDKTLNGTLDGLTGLLKPTTSAPATPPTTAPATPPPTSATPTAHPTSTSASPPPPRPTSPHASEPVAPVPSRTTHIQRPLSAEPVAETNPPARPRTHESRTSIEPVHAIDSAPVEFPQLDLATSLAGLTIAMVLGVGLLVHRAGYRGERARR